MAVLGSRPSRARGLKHAAIDAKLNQLRVAPLAGAWIETECAVQLAKLNQRRAPRGRVD